MTIRNTKDSILNGSAHGNMANFTFLHDSKGSWISNISKNKKKFSQLTPVFKIEFLMKHQIVSPNNSFYQLVV